MLFVICGEYERPRTPNIHRSSRTSSIQNLYYRSHRTIHTIIVFYLNLSRSEQIPVLLYKMKNSLHENRTQIRRQLENMFWNIKIWIAAIKASNVCSDLCLFSSTFLACWQQVFSFYFLQISLQTYNRTVNESIVQ